MKRKIDISFGGKEYTVKADFATIDRIEQKFDMMSFLRSMQQYKARARDIAWVLYCALIEAGEKVQYNEIGDTVLDDFEACATAATEIVAAALGSGPEKVSKKKSEKVTQDTPESTSSTESQ